MKLYSFFQVLFFISTLAVAQPAIDQARELKAKAVDMMDQGNPEDAVKLLEEAKKLDPATYVYDYEIGYAYFIQKDYTNAIRIFKEVIKYKDVNDQCYQMLGNIYDIDHDPATALKTYDRGLKRFPNSGRLYLEKGNVYWGQKKYESALAYYESGIKVEPQYSSNYYRATLIYLQSDEKIWGMIYGEIFINLERNTKRTSEISEMLFDAYKSQITFKGDTVMVKFSENNVTEFKDLKRAENFTLPFAIGAYEPALLMSLVGEKSVNLSSLDSIRTRFVDNYTVMGFDRKYPNVLFDYQRKAKAAGHLSAYNHWVLMHGDDKAFSQWQVNHERVWQAFIKWFAQEPLQLSDNAKFYRGQY
jgi:tetratricopeptide (TPR) repeat protein